MVKNIVAANILKYFSKSFHKKGEKRERTRKPLDMLINKSDKRKASFWKMVNTTENRDRRVLELKKKKITKIQ